MNTSSAVAASLTPTPSPVQRWPAECSTCRAAPAPATPCRALLPSLPPRASRSHRESAAGLQGSMHCKALGCRSERPTCISPSTAPACTRVDRLWGIRWRRTPAASFASCSVVPNRSTMSAAASMDIRTALRALPHAPPTSAYVSYSSRTLPLCRWRAKGGAPGARRPQRRTWIGRG